ncbi:MAG: hypothetical protein ABI361_12810 [Nitrososphaera sp.]
MSGLKFCFGPVPAILAAICITGALAAPFGDPRLLVVAIPIEVLFIALTILTALGYRKALYACLPLAGIVIIGNSLAPPHVQIMTTFSKPLNAVLLIIGGYVLQVALIAGILSKLKKDRALARSRAGDHSPSIQILATSVSHVGQHIIILTSSFRIGASSAALFADRLVPFLDQVPLQPLLQRINEPRQGAQILKSSRIA